MTELDPAVEMGVVGELEASRFPDYRENIGVLDNTLPAEYLKVSEECSEEIPWCEQLEGFMPFAGRDLKRVMDVLYAGDS